MSRKKKKLEIQTTPTPVLAPHPSKFHFSFLNDYQKDAWTKIFTNEIIFLIGPAGCGKTQIATAFAAQSILQKRARKFILCRPMVTTEQMGYLPGTQDDKLHPFLIPILDSLDECCGKDGPDRKRVDESIEFAPLAFMRGRSFNWSIAILDEAQNATIEQLKLFLTRIGKKSKLIITGDPFQSDLKSTGLMYIVDKLKDIEGIAVVNLPEAAQVRNPIINKILEKI
jgi:phosphate starvation-inducible protein PhoH and related proteins